MGSKGLTFFAFMCLISAARADGDTVGGVLGSIAGVVILGLCIWGCCQCCRHETNVTVVSPSGGGGGSNNQNSLVVNMPTQSAMPQPCAPMPHPPQYTQY